MADRTILKLTEALAGKIRVHGAETYPHECCGALLGREASAAPGVLPGGVLQADRDIVELFPLVNRRDDSPRHHFSVTSDDVRDAEKAARSQQLEVIGWYHSHPDHPAKPSDYDRDHAWPWYSYVIVSVANGKPQEMTSWRLCDDRSQFVSEDVAVCDPAG
jgi:proteasome lid subunit RPN8/RPN11